MALGPREVLTEIRVPKTSAGWAYEKFHPRAQDWAIVGVAAVVERSNGNVDRARIALTNMGPTPIRAKAVEEALAGGADAATAARSSTDGTERSTTRSRRPSIVATSRRFSSGGPRMQALQENLLRSVCAWVSSEHMTEPGRIFA